MSKKSPSRQPPAAEQPLSLPAAFLERMRALLDEEYAAFEATYRLPPRSGLRANTLKVSSAALADLLPFPLTPLPWPPAAFLLPGESQPGKHAYHAAGLYYLQDPAAMVPAALLAPEPGDRVLDLSAAPGGKATHLASLLAGTGLLVANEVHPQRVRDLGENLERWGARNVAITNETPERLAGHFASFFDRVLVDAPCSGEGMLRKSNAARLEWNRELIDGCALRQSAILESAVAMLRPGGVLGYVTCTFAPEENEGTVSRFLRTHPDFELVRSPVHTGFSPGRPDWLPAAESRPDLANTVHLWPQRFPGEGQFIALLRRAGSDSVRRTADYKDSEMQYTKPAVPGESRREARVRKGQRAPGRWYDPPGAGNHALYAAFCAENLTAVPAGSNLAVAGAYLYRIPDGVPDLSGLRYLHPGWWLGTFKKDRFEPSHALALALRPADVRRQADLDPNGPKVRAYLRGESLASSGDDGWVLVMVSGYALGWAKRVGGVLKSHFPRGLRRY